MKNKTLHESFWVARASRVLTPVRLGLSASRRNERHLNFQTQEKFAMTGRHRQHARSEPDWRCVRYPAGRTDA
ncbi:MAG: hypothetical protein DME37_08660 [Verrucomicrobia bacterium]|nr:MAG: hypothetical protein DME37_08660 [Verrucomicrobiota bacterium]PYM09878.1 MAG: hypothetical protein DMF15_04090 [Verrucomicrobiota bacterium]